MKIVDLEQGSPEWLAWRIGKGTASNAAAVIGQDPYKTAYKLWCEMTMRIPHFEGNKFTEAGTAMEPKARSIYEINHDFVEMKPACIVHEVHANLAASLDGLRMPDKKKGVEFKYPSEKTHELVRSGVVPVHYYAQVQHQFMVGDEVEEIDFCSLRENELLEVTVKRDPAMIELLEKSWLAFLELVKADVPPPLSAGDIKIIENDKALELLCETIKTQNLNKEIIKSLMAEAIVLAGHPKMKCGNVQISTVLRKGVFSYHKLTIGEGA